MLKLHPKQFEVYANQARFKVVVAGRRFGKSYLSRAILIREAKKPKSKVWYIAPSYRMARQIMWDELLDAIPEPWIRKTHETNLEIKLINGSSIELKGADNFDTLRGVGLSYVVLDECQDIHPDAWLKALRPTLATTGGGALFIGTPKSFNFLYELWLKGQQKSNRESLEWWSWQLPTITSPFVPDNEIEQARRDMDEKSFRQEFLASFEAVSGRVYYPFDRNLHVGNYPFNPRLPIWVGQDFNIDPMSSAIIQPQENGEVWIVDELIRFSSNTSEICDELERRYWRYMKQVTIYPDPASRSRQHARGVTDLDIFREKGFVRIKHRPSHPAIRDRVNSVNRLLKSGNGDIRLKVNETCKETINAFEKVIYRPMTNEIDKSLNIEHVLDAAGYAIEYEFPIRKVELVGISL